MHFYLLIPAYNEEGRIQNSINECSKLFKKYEKRLTVIYISESTDRTNALLRHYIKKREGVELIVSKRRLGKGGALVKGLKTVCRRCNKKDIVGFVDADGAVGAKEVEKLIGTLSDGKIDGVIGSRYMDGSIVHGRIGFARHMESRAYNMLVRVLYGFGYCDTQCGAKFFVAGSVSDLLDDIALHHLTFDLDILYRLKERDRTVNEVPIEYNFVGGGLPMPFVQIFLTTVGLRLSHTKIGAVVPGHVKGAIRGFLNKT